MLSVAHQTRVYLALEAVDMRKQFDGLWAQAGFENPRHLSPRHPYFAI